MSTSWMQAHLGTIVCKFGGDPAIWLRKGIFVPERKCPYHVTFDLNLDLEHTLDADRSGTIVCKFGRDPAVCLPEEAIFMPEQKCSYHVTFDLDLDLEHNLDVGPSGDHRGQIWWRASNLPPRRSDFHARTNVLVSRDL